MVKEISRENFIKFIEEHLFEFEKEKISKLCSLLGISFYEYIFLNESSISREGKLIIDFQTLTQIPLVKRIESLPESVKIENEELFKEVGMIVFKIRYVFMQFLKEKGRIDIAIEYGNQFVNFIEKLKNRLLDGEDEKEVDGYILKFRKEIEELEEHVDSEIKLVWNVSNILLEKISEKLVGKKCIANKSDFIKVFTEYKKCYIINNVDFFVILIYQLIDREPSYIATTKSKTGHGVLIVAKQFFNDDSGKGSRPILFKDKKFVLEKNPEELKKITIAVGEFLYGF